MDKTFDLEDAARLLCARHATIWFEERPLIKRPASGCLACTAIAEDQDLRAKLAKHEDGPGTPLGIMNGIFEYAERECGHKPHSAKHAFTTIIEYINDLRAKLEAAQESLKTKCGLSGMEEGYFCEKARVARDKLVDAQQPPDNEAWRFIVKYAYADGGDGARAIQSITTHYNAMRDKLAAAERERDEAQAALESTSGLESVTHSDAAWMRRLAASKEDVRRKTEALEKFQCGDCKDGVLYCDSLMFDLDREDEDQPCPRCAVLRAALKERDAEAQG